MVGIMETFGAGGSGKMRSIPEEISFRHDEDPECKHLIIIHKSDVARGKERRVMCYGCGKRLTLKWSNEQNRVVLAEPPVSRKR